MTNTERDTPPPRGPRPPQRQESAVLDEAHVGDIRGALGTIAADDTEARPGLSAKHKTLVAIVGPGLIVMVGDNDAGAFSTYSQAGQNYGTTLLWTLLLLVPVLYVNQEMVVRLGAVTGVGHARLILERFGRFWGAFSVVDLFLAQRADHHHRVHRDQPRTVVSGVADRPRGAGGRGGGHRRRLDRESPPLRAAEPGAGGRVAAADPDPGHGPPPGRAGRPRLRHPGPAGRGAVSTVILLIIGIVGTTVAPWQLFFQQSYIIDKRITPRFINYEKADLWLGIVIVVIGAGAMMAFCAATFAGHPEFGNFTDAGGIATGLGTYVGRTAGVLFALALIDASIIGASAVGLSTSYALGDVLGLRHSLHRGVRDAKGFYGVFTGLMVAAAVIVVIPGSPLGLITEGVQTLAGVLLPSATVFLLLLCNDREVLGPWANGRGKNIFTALVIAVLVLLSIVLTASVLFPGITAAAILTIFAVGAGLGVLAGAYLVIHRLRHPQAPDTDTDTDGTTAAGEAPERVSWRMPPLALLTRPELSTGRRLGLAVLRGYLVVAVAMVIVRVTQLALAGP